MITFDHLNKGMPGIVMFGTGDKYYTFLNFLANFLLLVISSLYQLLPKKRGKKKTKKIIIGYALFKMYSIRKFAA